MKLLFFWFLIFSTFQLHADSGLSDKDLLDIVNKKGLIDQTQIYSVEPITAARTLFDKDTQLIYIDYPRRPRYTKFHVAEAYKVEYIPDRELLAVYGWDFGNGNPMYPRKLSINDPNIFLPMI